MPRELVLSDVERRVALRRLGGLAALPAEALAALARLGRRRALAAGATLTATGVPLLLEGEWRLAAVDEAPGGMGATAEVGAIAEEGATAEEGAAAEESATAQESATGATAPEGATVALRAQAAGPQPEPAPGRPAQRVELAWLTGTAMPTLTTATGAVVLELPREPLEDALDEHFAAWLATTRAIAGRLLDRGLADGSGDALGSGPAGRDGEEPGAPTLSARLLALGRALPFARAHVDALLQLDEAAVEVALAPGVPAWRAGDAAHSLLVPLAADAPAALVGVGGVALLGQRPRAARLVPAAPARVLRVDAEQLLDVVEDHHRLARDLLTALAAALLRHH